jgi:hypothetical protein
MENDQETISYTLTKSTDAYIRDTALKNMLLDFIKSNVTLMEMSPASTTEKDLTLAQWILDVFTAAKDIGEGYNNTEDKLECLWTVCLLCRASAMGDANRNSKVVPNILKSGKVSESNPWVINDNYLLSLSTQGGQMEAIARLMIETGKYNSSIMLGVESLALLSQTEVELYTHIRNKGWCGYIANTIGGDKKGDIGHLVAVATEVAKLRRSNA